MEFTIGAYIKQKMEQGSIDQCYIKSNIRKLDVDHPPLANNYVIITYIIIIRDQSIMPA